MHSIFSEGNIERKLMKSPSVQLALSTESSHLFQDFQNGGLVSTLPLSKCL